MRFNTGSFCREFATIYDRDLVYILFESDTFSFFRDVTM